MPEPSEAPARRTRIGSVLVRLSIDEWPLLWNVLRGDMSLVGPRAEEVGRIDPSEPEWAELLEVRPGVTSAAMVAFGGEYNTTPVPVRRERELGYTRSGSPTKDWRILRQTLRVVAARGNVKR
jgi:lipopolysaccharide/colanic/teichoic acid biosynthesis glycosyltransferase